MNEGLEVVIVSWVFGMIVMGHVLIEKHREKNERRKDREKK